MDERRDSNVRAHIAYDDLREWIALAQRLGEGRTVAGASWQEDIGLAAEAILREEHGPCVIFDDPAELRGGSRGIAATLRSSYPAVRRRDVWRKGPILTSHPTCRFS